MTEAMEDTAQEKVSLRAMMKQVFRARRVRHVHKASRRADVWGNLRSKEFTGVSQSGEKWIIDHVFKWLLETERATIEGENWKRTAIDNQNYNFTSVAAAGADKRCPYALAVEPKVPTKFLFRGRVWVNAKDFAVCRIEAEPAKNPSFWIKRTDIRHSYLKVGLNWWKNRTTSLTTGSMRKIAQLANHPE